MIDLYRQHQDTACNGELSEDQIRALAAHKLARFIAEDVCAALRTYTEKVCAAHRSLVGEEEAAPIIGDPRDWSSHLLVDAIATIVLARAMSAR